jgi:hypothetical protein
MDIPHPQPESQTTAKIAFHETPTFYYHANHMFIILPISQSFDKDKPRRLKTTKISIYFNGPD